MSKSKSSDAAVSVSSSSAGTVASNRARSLESRAQAVLDRVFAEPNQGRFTERTVGNRRLVLMEVPTLLRNAEGGLIGVEFFVRLYNTTTGNEIRIDNVRRFVNPPLMHNGNNQPLVAMWQILRQSIEDNPNPEGWRAP